MQFAIIFDNISRSPILEYMPATVVISLFNKLFRDATLCQRLLIIAPVSVVQMLPVRTFVDESYSNLMHLAAEFSLRC